MTDTVKNAKTVRRIGKFWKRTDDPAPWFPGAVLPLLVLLGLFVLGATWVAADIEKDVSSAVASRLERAGVMNSLVQASGQAVRIRADARETTEVALHTIARSTRCDTWLGRFVCTSGVTVDLLKPGPGDPAAEQLQHFSVSTEAGRVVLSGDVPDRDEHDRILRKAEGQFAIVRNCMTIGGGDLTGEFPGVADVAIESATHLLQGQVSWSHGLLSITGTAAPEGIARVRGVFGSVDESARGGINVLSTTSTKNCNQQFSALLADNKIYFKTASADLEARSRSLLERLAALAKTCPGELVVKGHTDNRGDAVMNKSLSFERASTVRDALGALGVDLDRVTAVGYGEDHPVAENTTSTGRAENRRIEVVIRQTPP